MTCTCEATMAREIDRLLDERRPDRYRVDVPDDEVWLNKIAEEVEHLVCDDCIRRIRLEAAKQLFANPN
jgi:hypothetical protein